MTLPAYPAAVPVRYNDRQGAAHVYRDADEPVLLPFGFGLGALAGVTVDDMRAAADAGSETLAVTLAVSAGPSGARGALNLFAHCVGGHRVPRLSMLVGSEYLRLEAGQRREVRMAVPFPSLMDAGDGMVRVRLTALGRTIDVDVDVDVDVARGR